MTTATGALSDRAVLRAARDLRACAWGLEWGLYGLLAGSALAIGSVHPWAYVSVWWFTGVLVVLLCGRAWLVTTLRRRIGPRRFCFHPSGLWVMLDADTPYGGRAWSFDLSRPRVPRPVLLLPGLAFAAWVACQLVLLPPELVRLLSRPPEAADVAGWLPITMSVADTRRGLAFLVWALAVHVAAAAVLDAGDVRRRFRRLLAGFGLALALFALAQMAADTPFVYGFFRPLDYQGTRTVFGPFVNRNHFAAYANLILPVAVGLLVQAGRHLRSRIGRRANLRRVLVSLQEREGVAALLALVAALGLASALVASASRGGLAACLGGFAVVFVLHRRLRPALALPLVFVAVALSLYGVERTAARLRQIPAEAPGRTLIWRDALTRLRGYWPAGSGFNTFDTAVSRATLWTLPRGATPWREPYETSVAQAPRLGFRSIPGTPLLTWSREAHNDYLQVLIETGVPGLLLVLTAIVALVLRLRGDPWALAGLCAVLLHSLVDFPLHVPAVTALFVTLAALPGRNGGDPRGRRDLEQRGAERPAA